jgi:putative cardiolipin synthase
MDRDGAPRAALPGLILLAALAALAGCAAPPPVVKREPSYSLPAVAGGAELDQRLDTPLAEHPGQSGLRLVPSGLDAFALRALSARAAARSIDVQYYIWHNDLTGRALAAELLAAADRGVRVRMLLDDLDARSKDLALATLDQHENIEIRLFNAFHSRGSGALGTVAQFASRTDLNHRMHNKAWIVDGRIAMVGGRNIGDEYYGASDSVNFRDLDVAIVGDAVAQAGAVFDRYWNSAQVTPISAFEADRGATGGLPEVREKLAAAMAAAAETPYGKRLRESDEVARIVAGRNQFHWTDAATVIADAPEKAAGEPGDQSMLNRLHAELDSAQRSATLISPYFVPGKAGAEFLGGLEKRGVAVSVLTNSLAANDVVSVHAGYRRYRKGLLEDGVEFHELRPDLSAGAKEHESSAFGSRGASLHTKAFLVDDERCFVGSFNLDPRSAMINTEMGIVIRDAAFTADLRAEFSRLTAPERSYQVTLENGKIWWTGVDKNGPVRFDSEPEVGLLKRMSVGLIGLLPIESQL